MFIANKVTAEEVQQAIKDLNADEKLHEDKIAEQEGDKTTLVADIKALKEEIKTRQETNEALKKTIKGLRDMYEKDLVELPKKHCSERCPVDPDRVLPAIYAENPVDQESLDAYHTG